MWTMNFFNHQFGTRAFCLFVVLDRALAPCTQSRIYISAIALWLPSHFPSNTHIPTVAWWSFLHTTHYHSDWYTTSTCRYIHQQANGPAARTLYMHTTTECYGSFASKRWNLYFHFEILGRNLLFEILDSLAVTPGDAPTMRSVFENSFSNFGGYPRGYTHIECKCKIFFCKILLW